MNGSYRLEVIELDGPRRGIGMTDVDAAERLAEQWINDGDATVVTILATTNDEDSFSIRTLRSGTGRVQRSAWKTWIATRYVGERNGPVTATQAS